MASCVKYLLKLHKCYFQCVQHGAAHIRYVLAEIDQCNTAIETIAKCFNKAGVLSDGAMDVVAHSVQDPFQEADECIEQGELTEVPLSKLDARDVQYLNWPVPSTSPQEATPLLSAISSTSKRPHLYSVPSDTPPRGHTSTQCHQLHLQEATPLLSAIRYTSKRTHLYSVPSAPTPRGHTSTQCRQLHLQEATTPKRPRLIQSS